MHVNRRLLGWGLFFVALGAVPLAVRLGLVSDDVVSRSWTLWPLLLVGAGIGLLLRGTALEALSRVVVAVTFGLIIGGVLATGAVPFAGCGASGQPVPFAEEHGDLGPRGSVALEMNCGELVVESAPGTGWTIAGASSDGSPPRIEASTGRLVARTGGRSGLAFLRPGDDWKVTLPADAEVDVSSQVNAGSGRFAFGAATLGSITVGVNAGSATLDLGHVRALRRLDVSLNAAGTSQIVLPNLSFTGSIDANAARVAICPPAGTGLRLTTNDNITASNNYAERGLTRVGNGWETAGFATAPVRIELDTTANAAQFELLPAGSCHG